MDGVKALLIVFINCLQCLDNAMDSDALVLRSSSFAALVEHRSSHGINIPIINKKLNISTFGDVSFSDFGVKKKR